LLPTIDIRSLSSLLQTEIFPTVGLQTPLEAIEANFGLTPFKFDLEKYIDVRTHPPRRTGAIESIP
jgi:hypothetical protein